MIDAGNGIPHALAIKAAIAAAKLPPVTQIIYTHHHWDHIFGACVFDAPVVANQRTASLLERMAKQPWSDSFLLERQRKSPKRATQTQRMLNSMGGQWDDFRIVLPSLVFDYHHQIELPTISLTLTYIGGAHASDAITATVENEKLLFVGDCYYPPPEHEREPDEPVEIDLDIMEEFLSPDIKTYIDGHNPPFTGKQMAYMVNFARHRMHSRAG